MKKYLLLSLAFSLSGCVLINPGVNREAPGIEGRLLLNNKPAENIEVIYAKTSHYEDCNHILGYDMQNILGADRTDSNGRFKIPIDKSHHILDSNCEYKEKICIKGMKPWIFDISVKDTKVYHSGGSVIKEPLRLLFTTVDGQCDAPEWLNIECNLDKSSKNHCRIIGKGTI